LERRDSCRYDYHPTNSTFQNREGFRVDMQVLIEPCNLRHEEVDGRQVARRLEREGDAMPKGRDGAHILKAEIELEFA
jgi:hypothetical protein